MATLKVGTSASSLVEVPVEPDQMSWGLQDVSASDAGRVLDANNTMYKMRTSQKRKLSLSWVNPTLAQASAILAMFNPEYIFVRYPDVLAGGFETREFYVGDRSAPYRSITLADSTGERSVVSALSFDIIER